MNIFEQFEGADLERLTECLQAIKRAGLTVDKHAQAGVNQSSGNVWIWNEDWAGCVYCSIGFDVAWSHSCPECGEEWDFEMYSELEDYVQRYEGQCKACKPKFVAGWNMPGYMPDCEPVEFDDADDARQYIIDAIKLAEDQAETEEQAEELAAFAEEVNLQRGEFSAQCQGFVYFVTVES